MNGTALFVGDVSLDLTMVASHIPEPDEKVHVDNTIEAPGGVIANAAVAGARSGARVKALLQMGNDAAASMIAANLEAQGVEADIRNVEGRTCRVVSIIEPHGEKRLLLDPGVSMYPSILAVQAVGLTDIAWVHTAAYGEAAAGLIQKCRASGVAWSLDLEPASFAAGIAGIAALIDGAALVFCNDRAAAAIGAEAPAALLALGARAVIRTEGAKGAGFIAAGDGFHVSAPRLGAIVDTTGAGDCLAGWYVGEIVSGATSRTALEAAVTAATLSCRALGAQNSYPTRTEVSAFRQRMVAESSNKI